jgi:phosphohistidine swiveling domain-containing protein
VSGSPYVLALGGDAQDAARLGGKGASLSRLVALGHRVPPGFVLPVDAFEATVESLGLAPFIRRMGEALAGGGDQLAQQGAFVHDGLLAGRLPPEVFEPVLEAVRSMGLFAGGGVIVRSSATVEDSTTLSFAGIFESIPIQREEEIEPAIRQVWASLFSSRALTYVKESGLSIVPTMAIVVQRFLEATRSGVMFTEFDGPDGTPSILVEHVEGGCEKLVKGEVTPDRLWLRAADPVPEDLEGGLAAGHARELARLAGQLERQFGAPQDVEWLILDDEVHVVQSRPITASHSGMSSGSVSPPRGVRPLLAGVAASRGVGAGPVHLAFNIEQALALESGRVLVTPMTNPDMVVAMRNSAGIVTDVGGMICHAAIVSRELGLPCVVGTGWATEVLGDRQLVTVDGSAGVVYAGRLSPERPGGEPARPVGWPDLWEAWLSSTAGRRGLVPMLSSAAALANMPAGIDRAILVPDVDLRSDPLGLWTDLEGMPPEEVGRILDGYARRVAAALPVRPGVRIELRPIGTLSREALAAALARLGDARLLISDAGSEDGRGSAPLAAAFLAGRPIVTVGGVRASLDAALDTLTFFGHRPAAKVASMPDPVSRSRWWALLPEYGRFHREFGTEREDGEFEWLEVRPELVISALLKSLVQPGFEMVPRILGFRELPPMHIKWVRCRYHFRSDAFGRVWESIVRSTYDESFMADLMRRVRASYGHLEEVLRLFPQTDTELSAISGDHVVALITSWWPRWIEFFALCWFIQAQGDDIAYPFIDETARYGLASLGQPPPGLAWPETSELVAPTTPVMSGEYMADVGRLTDELRRAGVGTREEAEAMLVRGDAPALGALIAEHLRKWHWMRDRDLLFEPWDTPGRVIETALRTEPHTAPPYGENLRRNLFALSFHFDLAQASGRAETFNRMARFLHDLNVERENHHVLWLKFSYPLRRLILEVEKRLVEIGSIDPGDVFFLQAPELIDAASKLPEALPMELVARVKNRRAGYLLEARLAATGSPPASAEDDYY